MLPSRSRGCLGLILTLIFAGRSVLAQGPLQPGVPVERPIAAGQKHSYVINLQRGEFLRLEVQQSGIDLGVKVLFPDARRLGEFDTADGIAGAENIAVVAEFTGTYQFEVTPLDEFTGPEPGRYQIRIAELRNVTEQEWKDGSIQESLKANGLELLNEVARLLPEVRSSLTRARLQIRFAKALWGIDDARAVMTTQQAMDSVREFFSSAGADTRTNTDDIRTALDLRRQIIESLIAREPELALAMIQATRELPDPDGTDYRRHDRQMELSAATRIVSSNPRLAFQIAEGALTDGTAPQLVEILRQLQSKSPELAVSLARGMVTRLVTMPVLTSSSTADMAMDLVQFARPGGRLPAGSRGNAALIGDADFRSLYQKMVGEILAYSPPDSARYSGERSAAQRLATALKDMPDEFRNLQPDRAAALTRKISQLNAPVPTSRQPLTMDVANVTVDAGLRIADQAPPEMQETLYEQLALKAAIAGDIVRARQIIDDHLGNAARQRALKSLQRQSVANAIARGRFEEALRSLESERDAEARLGTLAQLVPQIGPGLKKSTATTFLEQARSMLSASARADGQAEMKALFGIAAAYSKINPERGFEMVEPLIDQFNELLISAMSMNGFREKYYRDGELITTNGNSLSEIADELAETLTALEMVNPPRARTVADRVTPVSIRINLYLEMAQEAVQPSR